MVSIIIPVYNIERYIGRCIESVVGQTHTDIEIIIIDDGSTDESGNICDEWQNRYENIRVIHITNQGVSVARNTGIAEAKGDWILFIDGDDFIHPYMIEILYSEAIKSDADICMCSYQIVDDNSYVDLNERPTLCISNEYNGVQAAHKLHDRMDSGDFVVIWNKLIRKEFFINIQFPEDIIRAEDELVSAKLYLTAKKITRINKKLYFYYTRADSVIGQNSLKSKFDAKEAFRRRMILFKDSGIKELASEAHLYYIDYCISMTLLKVNKSDKYRIKQEIRQLVDNNILKNYSSGTRARLRIFGVSTLLYRVVMKIYFLLNKVAK